MILLSFDIEEFDAPLEHGVELPFGGTNAYFRRRNPEDTGMSGPSPGKSDFLLHGELRPSRKGFDLGHPKGWT